MPKTSGKLKTVFNWLLINHRLPAFFPNWAMLPPDNQESTRVLTSDKTVRFTVEGAELPFADHIELSGYAASHIISYRVKADKKAEVFIHSVYPQFRMRPNVTEASYSHNFVQRASLTIDGKPCEELVRFVDIKGKLCFISSTGNNVEIRRTFFPAVYTTALVEKIEVENLNEDGEVVAEISVPKIEFISLPKYSDTKEAYLSKLDLADEQGKMLLGFDVNTKRTVAAGKTECFYAVYYTRPKDDDILVDAVLEEKKRDEFINRIFSGLRIETPEPIFNAAFSHAVLRGSESVFSTKVGNLHCPGGGSYYAAIWTNDNVEYAAPFFGYAGLDTQNEAILNGIRLFAAEIDSSTTPIRRKKSVPASITSEGDRIWRLAGDRGDSQMFGSGAARFALALGDKHIAEELFKHIEFCVDYTKAHTDKKGRVLSDSDELENRFPHGKANLSTNCLAYDLYLSASYLAGELGRTGQEYEYFNLAAKQRSAIIKNFSYEVEGYKTFRYFQNNRKLRSWICMPMCVGIYDFAQGTADALYSDKLYDNGYLKTASYRNTTWDRSLLFALRGSFRAGFVGRSVAALRDYTRERLLGMHAPYAYEAYPEGNRRHLSAESLLYARIFTEGLLGLQFLGFGRFTITPSLPTEWRFFRIKHLVVGNMPVDICIEDRKLTVTDMSGKVVTECNVVNGQKVYVDLLN